MHADFSQWPLCGTAAKKKNNRPKKHFFQIEQIPKYLAVMSPNFHFPFFNSADSDQDFLQIKFFSRPLARRPLHKCCILLYFEMKWSLTSDSFGVTHHSNVGRSLRFLKFTLLKCQSPASLDPDTMIVDPY